MNVNIIKYFNTIIHCSTRSTQPQYVPLKDPEVASTCQAGRQKADSSVQGSPVPPAAADDELVQNSAPNRAHIADRKLTANLHD